MQACMYSLLSAGWVFCTPKTQFTLFSLETVLYTISVLDIYSEPPEQCSSEWINPADAVIL